MRFPGLEHKCPKSFKLLWTFVRYIMKVWKSGSFRNSSHLPKYLECASHQDFQRFFFSIISATHAGRLSFQPVSRPRTCWKTSRENNFIFCLSQFWIVSKNPFSLMYLYRFLRFFATSRFSIVTKPSSPTFTSTLSPIPIYFRYLSKFSHSIG